MNDSFLNENLLVYPNDPFIKESNELLESLGNVLPVNIVISITQTHTYYVIKMFTKSLQKPVEIPLKISFDTFSL